MPKRDDIKKILIIGPGPIVIGQACEFDYSGTQACKALKEEGYEIVLVNSNPATIMTDPEFADRTYIEPLTPKTLEKIISKERPDCILPTMGGQTALNLAVALHENGVLDKYNVELIGANIKAIRKAEDRDLFKQAMERIGMRLPAGGFAKNLEEAAALIEEIKFPAIIRPSFTLGGTGGSVAYNMEEFELNVIYGIDASPVGEVLIEESIIGWKEYELEVMRDKNDNVVIICSIENFDPMGIHTGDSITVAPAQTLTDKEYQILRDSAIKIIREIGVDTGGSNIQFAVNPANGELVIIEMNPRVSRSSALASKATGFPIAKFAAKLAVGYTLNEIQNDITKETPASFEPTIDYVVTKIPRFAFEKFKNADKKLTTQMKSVGEAMAIGRTFKESLQKAMRSLEIDSYGFETRFTDGGYDTEYIKKKLSIPKAGRLFYIADALRAGYSIEKIFECSKIDPWFINEIKQIVDFEGEIIKKGKGFIKDKHLFLKAKRLGFADRRIADIIGITEDDVRKARTKLSIGAAFKMVDTCAAEFEAYTPYLYSTYETEDEASPTDKKKVMILGGGPNRIGQGIEFDYCCVHGSFALKEDGYETIMVNCNPETVSTDYDTSDRLYFEPLTKEDVLNIAEREKPYGVIVQFGGQTPLKLAIPLERAGVKIIGTSPDSIDLAEDRERFSKLIKKLGLKQPASGIAFSFDDAKKCADKIGYPVMVRPSYVLGGRAMEIVYNERMLKNYLIHAVKASPEQPILIDRFLPDAIEVDVDAVSDGRRVIVAGIMEHIEEAGIHSGDSACSLPPHSLSEKIISMIEEQTIALAVELKVCGLMNVQFAVKNGEVYILEVNPRASRTVPFVSKATGVPLAKVAARVMAGKTLDELGLTKRPAPDYISVKEAVFPFEKFPGVDTILGPEMRSTGEVMGIDPDFALAFAKAQEAAGFTLPLKGRAFISIKDSDKNKILTAVKDLVKEGFEIVATRGTAKFLQDNGIDAVLVNKVIEGRPNIIDSIKSDEIDIVINTTIGEQSIRDSYSIRRTTLLKKIPYCTTIEGADSTVKAISKIINEDLSVKPLQEYHRL
jgi:carbamoyl-phosphate synthase large subunit